MDIYNQKSRWKIYLAIAGLLIVGLSMVYTNYLANRLKDEERKRVESYLIAQEQLSDPSKQDVDYECDLTLHLKIIVDNTTIPVILMNGQGKYVAAVNFGEDKDNNEELILKELEKMKEEGRTPIEGGPDEMGNPQYYIWYKDSTLLTLIKYFPIVQFCLIAAFITFGYLSFSSARRAEQNQVWVGMAKETAHQLGTPISAILAWIEHLKEMRKDDPDTQEVLQELLNDVDRLDLIADRFSKIGSAPTLEAINIYEELEKCRVYMQRRAPRKVAFDFPGVDHPEKMVNINPGLFDWVIENLLRNALDAMGGKGQISAKIYEEKDMVCIDVSDTGKGIPSSKFKTVFQPGFTTKKRGWGLGLSLAKRIIESYHSGRIFVKKSVLNEGTTFTIRLPKG